MAFSETSATRTPTSTHHLAPPAKRKNPTGMFLLDLLEVLKSKK
jgi:hypothetical protein